MPLESECVMCDVCGRNMGRKDGACPNGGMTCDCNHSVCIDCARQRVTPVPKCSPKCIGLRYSCPVCNAPHCVSPFHMLVLVKGNWLKANACFDERREIFKWNANDAFETRRREVY